MDACGPILRRTPLRGRESILRHCAKFRLERGLFRSDRWRWRDRQAGREGWWNRNGHFRQHHLPADARGHQRLLRTARIRHERRRYGSLCVIQRRQVRGHRRPGRICKFVYYALLFFVRDRGGNFGLFASRRVIVGPSHEQGYTALHLAADRGNVATVELLLKQGADKTLKVSLRVMNPLNVLNFSNEQHRTRMDIRPRIWPRSPNNTTSSLYSSVREYRALV